MSTLILYSLFTTAMYYLGARALITKFLWSRYPEKLDDFMSCAACSGFWYGALAGVFGFVTERPFLWLPGDLWYTIPLVGLSSMVWTPILAAVHLKAMLYVGKHWENDL